MEPKLSKDEKKALRQEEIREKLKKQATRNKLQTLGFWAVGGLLLVLALWALVAFSSNTNYTKSALTAPKVTSKDFQTGPATAKATLIEYADFECPACKAYYPVIKQLQAQEGSKMNFVYRFFPLKTIHPNAVSSAQAAYAASLQGKFWQMHDKLFETQDTWAGLFDPESTFVGYAKSLGLNTDTFKKDYEAPTTNAFVNTSYDDATTIGLNATPTFFVNGKQIDNPQSYQDFADLINKSIK